MNCTVAGLDRQMEHHKNIMQEVGKMRNNMKAMILYLFAIVFLLALSTQASAAVHLNISIVETVNQTVKFNYNANLTQNITYYNVTGKINISNPANETMYDIYIKFVNTNMFGTNLTNVSGRPGRQISGTPGQPFVIHIPELRYREYIIFRYTLKNQLSLTPPLLMQTNYTHKGWAKIIADREMRVVSFVTNRAQIMKPITGINISIRAQNITWGSQVDWFRLNTLSSTGDFANVQNTANSYVWYWRVNGGSLPYGQKRNITYQVHVPANVPQSGFYNATIDSFRYSIAYALSNLTVSVINASSRAELNLQKEIWAPTDGNNVTWRATPQATTKTDITFNLTSVTVWVTRNMNPNNFTGLSHSYPRSNLSTFNRTRPWGGNVSKYAWYFNYTDGSNPITAPPPIVWMDANYIVYNRYNQLWNRSYTFNGKDIYIREIYIINGFWLEVNKTITNIALNQYRIKLWVHNKGTGWTPTNLTVTVYDFVPSNFSAWNYSPFTPNMTRNVGGVGQPYTGRAYMWYIGRKMPKNASLAPNNVSSTLDEWNTTYTVNGTGDYKVSDLYIVGLDPQLVDGSAGVSPLIVIVTSLVNYGKEMIYMVIAMLLLVANTVIFYTRKKRKSREHGHHGHKVHEEIRNISEEIERLKQKLE